MTEILIALGIILNMGAIGLGIGSSTLAVAIFLTAIKDNIIDISERKLLGVVYIVLRIAMVLILLTTLGLLWQAPELLGSRAQFSLLLIAVLFTNAFCMTKHCISMRIGPAIQAGTWYTLGFITTIHMFALYEITWSNFFILYGIDIALALFSLNAYLTYIKKKNA